MLNAHDSRAIINKVLQRVGFFDAISEPPEMDTFVSRSRQLFLPERLEELERAFSGFNCPAQSHSHWTDELTSQISLSEFRSESSYMWQYRDGNVPLTYVATYYYHLMSENRDLLPLCREDRAFGVYCVEVQGELISRDRLDSVSELGFIRRHLGLTTDSVCRIIDIGSGYGRLGWRMNQCFPSVEMLCTDAVPRSSFLCESYLMYRGVVPKVRMIALPYVERELSAAPVALATIINSLSECSANAISWWIELLSKNNVPRIMFVPHAAHEQGRRIFSHEGQGNEPIDVEPILEQYGYQREVLEPKYSEEALQRYGVTPTHYHLFARPDLTLEP
jgi:hypothetical protein